MKKMLLIMAVVALLIPINALARMSAPKGKLIDAKTGKVLATFEHESTSGLQNGDKWSLVESRVQATGDKISEFVQKLSR